MQLIEFYSSRNLFFALFYSFLCGATDLEKNTDIPKSTNFYETSA